MTNPVPPLRPDAYSTLAGLEVMGAAPITFVARRSVELLRYLTDNEFVTVHEEPDPFRVGTTRLMMSMTPMGQRALTQYRTKTT